MHRLLQINYLGNMYVHLDHYQGKESRKNIYFCLSGNIRLRKHYVLCCQKKVQRSESGSWLTPKVTAVSAFVADKRFCSAKGSLRHLLCFSSAALLYHGHSIPFISEPWSTGFSKFTWVLECDTSIPNFHQTLRSPIHKAKNMFIKHFPVIFFKRF
jgi:hypothetical protein